jgi:hypothetical protein
VSVFPEYRATISVVFPAYNDKDARKLAGVLVARAGDIVAGSHGAEIEALKAHTSGTYEAEYELEQQLGNDPIPEEEA